MLAQADEHVLPALLAALSDDTRAKLTLLLENIEAHPDEAKYRTLRTTNRSMTKLLDQPSVAPLLELAGFRGEDGESLVFAAEAPLDPLKAVLRAVEEPPLPQQEAAPVAQPAAAAAAAEGQLRALLRGGGSSPETPQKLSPAAASPTGDATPAEERLRELLRGSSPTEGAGAGGTPVARPRIRVESSPVQRAAAAGTPPGVRAASVAGAGGTPLMERLGVQPRREPEPEPEPEQVPESDSQAGQEQAAAAVAAAAEVAAAAAAVEAAADKAAADKAAAEKAAADNAAAERAAAERAATERAAARARLAVEQAAAAADKVAAERVAAEMAAAAKAAADRAAAERADAERAAPAKAAAEKAAAEEQAQAARIAQEQADSKDFGTPRVKQVLTLMGGLSELESRKAELKDLRAMIASRLQEAERRHLILRQRIATAKNGGGDSGGQVADQEADQRGGGGSSVAVFLSLAVGLVGCAAAFVLLD